MPIPNQPGVFQFNSKNVRNSANGIPESDGMESLMSCANQVRFGILNGDSPERKLRLHLKLTDSCRQSPASNISQCQLTLCSTR